MGVYRCGWPRVVALNFQSNSSTGATRHVYDIFGEIVTDYSDIVRVFSTFVRVLRHPYEIPSTFFESTTCFYEFISLHNRFRGYTYSTITYGINTELVGHSTTIVRLCTIQSDFCMSYNIASLENNHIYVHLHTLHFQSFRTRVILYPSHFVPKSFRTMLFISYRTHL